MTKEEIIKRLIEIKELEDSLKIEKEELKSQLDPIMEDKENMFGYSISRQSKPTYSLKEGVDVVSLSQQFPEFIKMDCGKLYKVLENVDEIIEKKETSSIVIKASKKKEEVLEY